MEAKFFLRLKWKDPTLGNDSREDESDVTGRDPGSHVVCGYDFVTEAFPHTRDLKQIDSGNAARRRGCSSADSSVVVRSCDVGKEEGLGRAKGAKMTRGPLKGYPEVDTQKGQHTIEMTKSWDGESFVSVSFQAGTGNASSASPRTGSVEWLGCGRRNPFESYPIPMSAETYELVDQCKSVSSMGRLETPRAHTEAHADTVLIPILMYGTRCKNPVQKSLYHLGLNDIAAFHAILAYSARHLDSLHGVDGSPRSLRHTIAAVRAVNDKLRSDNCQYDDATVFSAALMAITEVSLVYSNERNFPDHG